MITKLDKADFNRLFNLFQKMKPKITLDERPACISRLGCTFPVVFSRDGKLEAEFAWKTVERILRQKRSSAGNT